MLLKINYGELHELIIINMKQFVSDFFVDMIIILTVSVEARKNVFIKMGSLCKLTIGRDQLFQTVSGN